MSGYTKGPIVIDEQANGMFLLTSDRTATDVEGVGLVYKRADAQLFSVAHELLEFVRNQAKRDPVFAKGHDKQVIADAKALIAKAEGRS